MNQNFDHATQKPIRYKKMKVSRLAVLCAVWGILLYFADIISDISLAVKYYYEGHTRFFGLTLSFVIISAVISSLFSFYMYWSDSKKTELNVSKTEWTLRTIFLILGIAPVLRTFDSLRFAWEGYQSKDKSKKCHYARRMIFEIADGSFLRLFEAFLESGPQLVLQIYIFLEMQKFSPSGPTETEIQRYYTMLISAISISGSIVAYSNSLRNSLDDKNELKWYLLTWLFLWRFFEIISRVIAMGLGISATPYFHCVFIAHFLIVTVWIYFMETDFTENKCTEKFYNALLGVILTFVFLNPEDSPTERRCMYFYMGMFAENVLLMSVWYHKNSCSPDLSLQFPIVYIQVLCFLLSIGFMVLYYKIFHPTVGKLYKNKQKKTDALGDAAETAAENEETSGMFETGQHAGIEIVIQNEEGNVMWQSIQDVETESVMQNGKVMLERGQSIEAIETVL